MTNYGKFCSKRDIVFNLMTDEKFVTDSLSGKIPKSSGLTKEVSECISDFFFDNAKKARPEVPPNPLILLEFLTSITRGDNDEFMSAEPLFKNLVEEDGENAHKINEMFEKGSFFHSLAKRSQYLNETEALLIRHHIKCKFFSIPEKVPPLLVEEDIDVVREYIDLYEPPLSPLENPFLEDLFSILNQGIKEKAANLSAEELYYLMIAERFSFGFREGEEIDIGNILESRVPEKIRKKLNFIYLLGRINEPSYSVFIEIMDEVDDHYSMYEVNESVS